MQLNHLQPNTSPKRQKRVGRGGAHGKTSGRGHKGQKSRAGHRIRPAIRDAIKKIPKLRGHGTNRSRTVNTGRDAPAVVNVGTLEERYDENEQVTPATLLAHGLVSRSRGRAPSVKILGDGELKKKLAVSGCSVSTSAREAIEKAGGTVA